MFENIFKDRECKLVDKCFNCQKEICEEHASKILRLDITSRNDGINFSGTYHFCSGMCLFSWNLAESCTFYEICTKINGLISTPDSMKSWIPVMKQLREEIEKEIKNDN